MEKCMTTPRLVLKPMAEEDCSQAVAILRHDKVKATYMLPDLTEEAAGKLFRRLMELSNGEDHYVRGIYLNDTLIGWLNDTEIENGEMELGWALHPDFHNQGYATEAVKAAIHGLFRAGYRRINAGAFDDNPASLRVMQKVGMTLQEKTEEIEYRGKTHRCIYYAISSIFVETPRLLLRTVQPEDYSYFRSHLMDKEMDRMMCRYPTDTEEDARLGFDWFLYKEERAYVILLKETGTVIGNLVVYNRVPQLVADHPAVAGKTGRSLSFALSRPWQRKGLMTEAVRAVMDRLFRVEGIDYINCGYLTHNLPSKVFQESLGFAYLTEESFTMEEQTLTSVENILWRKC